MKKIPIQSFDCLCSGLLLWWAFQIAADVQGVCGDMMPHFPVGKATKLSKSVPISSPIFPCTSYTFARYNIRLVFLIALATVASAHLQTNSVVLLYRFTAPTTLSLFYIAPILSSSGFVCAISARYSKRHPYRNRLFLLIYKTRSIIRSYTVTAGGSH